MQHWVPVSAGTDGATPSGDPSAVIPLAEYERLVEAAENDADVRAYDEARSAASLRTRTN